MARLRANRDESDMMIILNQIFRQIAAMSIPGDLIEQDKIAV